MIFEVSENFMPVVGMWYKGLQEAFRGHTKYLQTSVEILGFYK